MLLFLGLYLNISMALTLKYVELALCLAPRYEERMKWVSSSVSWTTPSMSDNNTSNCRIILKNSELERMRKEAAVT
jgi:hypothetical protein